MLLEKIPIIKAGKIEDAANPKANATVPAAKSGGLNPKYQCFTHQQIKTNRK